MSHARWYLRRVSRWRSPASAWHRLQPRIFEQVLVKVNGDIVTKSEFEQRQVSELRTAAGVGQRLAGRAPNSARPWPRSRRT
jgi:hypothetical protein